MMYLIRKTGEGKSLVMQGMASMLKGITVSVVPLLGLGSDQADKCNVDSVAVEAYHIDEFRGSHADLLRMHLQKYTREEKTIYLCGCECSWNLTLPSETGKIMTYYQSFGFWFSPMNVTTR
jgi:hypothetical protein